MGKDTPSISLPLIVAERKAGSSRLTGEHCLDPAATEAHRLSWAPGPATGAAGLGHGVRPDTPTRLSRAHDSCSCGCAVLATENGA